ncbi:sigma-54-dependent transcriptional regulator EatR [Methylosinus sp. 3S-1]|uniref:Sigma-54-dependent Fis family transcriptional regulator n=1 Tax=Methylosinus trichosporium (strain ATCC 35070 / NCIMB 11131 / UNIQEM 75 / OB3b) TaxID=595536 RepID=A0A2D2D158_METT3|nr:sigma-54-dependent Fis family transcriptional regulator [Methylosinus trichosporium OB3b]
MSEIAVRKPVLERPQSSGPRPCGEDAGLHGVDRPGVAWDWMRQTGQAPSGADWVRPQVAEAWARCIDEHALTPGVELAPRLREADAPAMEATISPAAAHLAEAAYDLRALLGDAEVALLLTDPDATLIQFFDHGLEMSAGWPMTRVGADWSEAAIGNTGVGAACLLREPAAFDGKEHFNRALHRFATAGCPILGPDGRICAIIGLISARRDSARLMLGCLKIARRVMEASLFEHLVSDGYLLRLRASAFGDPGGRYAAGGRVFVAADGRIQGVDRIGRELLEAAAAGALIGEDVGAAIGVELSALKAASDDARAVPVKGRGARLLIADVHRAPRRDASSAAASSAGCGAELAELRACDAEWRDGVLETALRKASGLQERNIPILITGESGVGKDHLVRRLHAIGPRKDRPLVAINCAAIPRELIESELFGYEGGSFTGARAKGKPGKFVEADKGILFLDEIGDMAADLQATLLRVLDSSEVVPIGSSKPIRVDVRVVAATNRSLPEMVQKGTFRRDLYYRLNGVQLWLPPLRERPDRLRLLAHLFRIEQEQLGVAEAHSFADEVWRVFLQHPWPGNIREARNVLRSSIAVARERIIRIEDLPVDFMQELNVDSRRQLDASLLGEHRLEESGETSLDLSDWEARAVRFALASSNGNIAKAARSLGITRATLYHKMARYGLQSDRRIISKR